MSCFKGGYYVQFSFKPYYKWNTFNTVSGGSIFYARYSFKPYYKWNTFNTLSKFWDFSKTTGVLNLIINGIPSILNNKDFWRNLYGFKPYYKWNTFNTNDGKVLHHMFYMF